MRRLMPGFVLALSLVSAAPLFALHTGGSPVVIPVIGRFPGAGGTQWRTDVFLANPYTPTQVVTLKFYPGGGAVSQATLTLAPFSSATLSDIVLNTFGMANAGGVLMITTGESLTIEARATIYNSGNPAGIFGQGLPGIATGYLSRQAYLFGISGISGNRVNIGAANPHDFPIDVAVTVSSASGVSLASRNTTIAPHAYVQYNDIFTTFGLTPAEGLTVNIFGSDLLYGYSSEVRNDTGDAVFNFGISPNQ